MHVEVHTDSLNRLKIIVGAPLYEWWIMFTQLIQSGEVKLITPTKELILTRRTDEGEQLQFAQPCTMCKGEQQHEDTSRPGNQE